MCEVVFELTYHKHIVITLSIKTVNIAKPSSNRNISYMTNHYLSDQS